MAFNALSNRTFGVGLKNSSIIELEETKLSNKEKILFKMILKTIIFFSYPIKMLKKQNRKKLDSFIKDYLK